MILFNGIRYTKMIVKVDVVGKKFGTRFLIHRARFIFNILKQAFGTASISNKFNPKCLI